MRHEYMRLSRRIHILFILSLVFINADVIDVFGDEIIYYPLVDCQLMVLPEGYSAYLPIELIFDSTRGCHTQSDERENTTSFYYCSAFSYIIEKLANGKCKKVYAGCSPGGYSVVNEAIGESIYSLDIETEFDCLEPDKQFGSSTCF